MITETMPRLEDLVIDWFTRRHWHETDYLLFANDHNALLELIDGKVVLQPMPTPRHQAAVVKLAGILGQSSHGAVYVAPMPVRLGPDLMREPDVAFYRHPLRDRIHDQYADPPDIVVEVLSPSTRAIDLGEKRREYAEAGIPEYWIVDLDARELAVHLLAGQEYASARRYGKGKYVESRVAPDVMVDVDAVVGEAGA